MKFNTLTRRAAAAGGTTALVAGALVGFTATSASAAVGPITYSCPTAIGTLPVTLASTDIPALPAVAAAGPYAAGSAVAAGLLPPGSVMNHFTITDATKQALQNVGTSNIHFTSFKGAFGNSFVPAVLPDVATSSLHDDGDGNWSFDANGTNAAFNNPKAGTWDVFAPASFSFIATTGAGDVPVTCTATSAPPSYGTSIVVVKNDSVTKGSSNTPVKHGAKAVLKAKVTAPNHRPTGTVTFKEGTKKLGSVKLKKGVATLSKSLSKGTHKIKAYYGGDGYTNKSTSSVFKVVQK